MSYFNFFRLFDIIRKFFIKLKNYNVKILDAEAEHLTHEQTAEKIVKENKELVQREEENYGTKKRIAKFFLVNV